MSQISDYDKRQLNLMTQQLLDFERGRISLFSLQSSLEFLLQAMEHVDESWEYSFLEEISTIGSINARIPENISQDYIDDIVNQSIRNLKNLIKKLLK